MLRTRTLVAIIVAAVILIVSLYILNNTQVILLNLLWAIFQLKFLIYTAIGILIGYFLRYFQEKVRFR